MEEKAIRHLIFIAQVNAIREYYHVIKDDLVKRDKYVCEKAMKSLSFMFKQFEKSGAYNNALHDKMVTSFLGVAEQIEEEIIKNLKQ